MNCRDLVAAAGVASNCICACLVGPESAVVCFLHTLVYVCKQHTTDTRYR